MNFGEKLRALREKQGYTQQQLAKKAGVGNTTVVYAEAQKGQKRPARYAALRFETLQKITQALGVDNDSKAFQEIALLWLEDQLTESFTAARSRKLFRTVSSKSSRNELESLNEYATSSLDEASITLLNWAAREPHALSLLKTLKAFQEEQKPKAKKRTKRK